MSVLIRFLRAIWDLVIGTAADALQWLRKPGSKLKAVCAVLAFGCMVSALSAYEKEQKIRDLKKQRTEAGSHSAKSKVNEFNEQLRVWRRKLRRAARHKAA